MKEDLQKLSRLIDIHAKLVEIQTNAVSGFVSSVANCEQRMQNLLLSIELSEDYSMLQTATFSQRMQVIKENQVSHVREIELAQAEQRRLSAIIEKLNERRVSIIESNGESNIAEAVDEWLYSHARES